MLDFEQLLLNKFIDNSMAKPNKPMYRPKFSGVSLEQVLLLH